MMAQDDSHKSTEDIDAAWDQADGESVEVPVAAPVKQPEASLELVAETPAASPEPEVEGEAPELEVGSYEYADLDIDVGELEGTASSDELESGLHEKDPTRVPSIPELSLEPPVQSPAGPADPTPHLSEAALPVQGVRAEQPDPSEVPGLEPPRARAPSLELDELSLDLDDSPPARQTPEEASRFGDLSTGLELASDRPSAIEDPAFRDMKDRYAMGDFSGALVVAEGILEGDPEDLEARRYAQSCHNVLIQMYSARLGPLDQIVSVAVPPDQVRWLNLDHRSGFLLSMIDGTCSVEELLDVSGMPRLDALRILHSLREQQVISLSGGS